MTSTTSKPTLSFEPIARELSAPLLRYLTRQVGDAAASIDDALLIDEMNSCVCEVIDSLPPDYRTALILHDLEGMSLERTAAVSQCALPTAKIRIHRARQRLKAALARECDFYRDSDSVFRCTRA